MSRRTVLTAAAATAVGALAPGWRRVRAAERPPGFPSAVEVAPARYANWSREIVVDGLWTCRLTSADQVAAVVTWAAGAGWRVRPRGAMHGWSPFTVAPRTPAGAPVVLVDTSGLAGVAAAPGGVRAGAGAPLVRLLEHLDARDLGLLSVPATGDVTVGGMLAIGAHGAATPGAGERRAPRATFGSLSQAAREVTAVVWDRRTSSYVPRTFGRDDRAFTSVACSLGRTFVTEAVLDAAPRQHLRCVSRLDIPAEELFGLGGGRTLASCFDAGGRAEALWYPFTDKPWLKAWEVAPTQPLTSRRTSGPYNYPFSDQVPEEVAELARSLVTGNPEATPTFGRLTYDVTAAGLAACAAHDLWGPAMDTQLYIRATTLRVRELGLAVMTSREHLQAVVHLLADRWASMVAERAAAGSYPINMPFEIRAASLDGDLGPSPILSATSPDPSAPHLDVVLFTNPLTLTGTPGSDAFLAEYERFVRGLDPALARMRPEWSKSFACTEAGAATDTAALGAIRDGFRRGRRPGARWDDAAGTFDALDPHRVFSSPFLDALFGG